MSKMAAMAAILKYFKQHLLSNRKLVLSQNLMGASERYRDSE